MVKLRGCGTALVTPFLADGSIDEKSLRSLVAWQIDSGIDFLVPCGTTGETPTLSHDEWRKVIETTIEVAAGRVPIVAGATSNCTAEAVQKAAEVSRIKGVDAILSASPYYNKPTQEGQYQHFLALAREVAPLPVALYNVPGRTAANLEPVTAARLAAAASNIQAIKEACGKLAQFEELVKVMPRGFKIFSGDDGMALPAIEIGAHGLISVASNEIPAETARMVRAALKGDWTQAREIEGRYAELFEANFWESNPAPVKAVLSLMGRSNDVLRLPLVPATAATRARLEKLAGELGLLKPAAAMKA